MNVADGKQVGQGQQASRDGEDNAMGAPANPSAPAPAKSSRSPLDLKRGPARLPRTTADDPNFLQTFFKSSRLHFTGVWKSRFEAILHSLPAPPEPPVTFDMCRNFLYGEIKARRDARRERISVSMF